MKTKITIETQKKRERKRQRDRKRQKEGKKKGREGRPCAIPSKYKSD